MTPTFLVLLAFASACSSRSESQPPTSGTPGPSVGRNDTLVVLGFEKSGQGVVPDAVIDQVTDGFRRTAAVDTKVSPTRRYALEEKIMNNCDAKPRAKAPCMAKVGKGLKADWLLWGTVEAASGGGYTVAVQLVPTAYPADTRMHEAKLASETRIDAVTRSLWKQLD